MLCLLRGIFVNFNLLVQQLLTLPEHLSSPLDLGYLCLTEADLNVIKIRFVCLLYPM